MPSRWMAAWWLLMTLSDLSAAIRFSQQGMNVAVFMTGWLTLSALAYFGYHLFKA
jgi:hypothetical protein